MRAVLKYTLSPVKSLLLKFYSIECRILHKPYCTSGRMFVSASRYSFIITSLGAHHHFVLYSRDGWLQRLMKRSRKPWLMPRRPASLFSTPAGRHMEKWGFQQMQCLWNWSELTSLILGDNFIFLDWQLKHQEMFSFPSVLWFHKTKIQVHS